MPNPLVYVDFNNADANGRIRLNCVGTIRDLARLGVRLADGLPLTVRDDDLQADAVVAYSAEERIWVAEINRPNRNLPETAEYRAMK